MSKASLLELCHGEKRYETFSINESKASLLLNCRAMKMYEIVNKHVKKITPHCIGTCKSAYTMGYALN